MIQMFYFKGLPKMLFARSLVGNEELFVYPFKQLPAWSNFTLKYGSNPFNYRGTTEKSESTYYFFNAEATSIISKLMIIFIH